LAEYRTSLLVIPQVGTQLKPLTGDQAFIDRSSQANVELNKQHQTAFNPCG